MVFKKGDLVEVAVSGFGPAVGTRGVVLYTNTTDNSVTCIGIEEEYGISISALTMATSRDSVECKFSEGDIVKLNDLGLLHGRTNLTDGIGYKVLKVDDNDEDYNFIEIHYADSASNTGFIDYVSPHWIEKIAAYSDYIFKSGDKVRIRRDSTYSDQSYDDGIIYESTHYSIDQTEVHCIAVRWSTYNSNSYRPKDLELVTKAEDLDPPYEYVELSVGDTVELRKDSPRKGQSQGNTGIITAGTSTEDRRAFRDLNVKWLHGFHEAYAPTDLILIKKKEKETPTFEEGDRVKFRSDVILSEEQLKQSHDGNGTIELVGTSLMRVVWDYDGRHHAHKISDMTHSDVTVPPFKVGERVVLTTHGISLHGNQSEGNIGTVKGYNRFREGETTVAWDNIEDSSLFYSTPCLIPYTGTVEIGDSIQCEEVPDTPDSIRISDREGGHALSPETIDKIKSKLDEVSSISISKKKKSISLN